MSIRNIELCVHLKTFHPAAGGGEYDNLWHWLVAEIIEMIQTWIFLT